MSFQDDLNQENVAFGKTAEVQAGYMIEEVPFKTIAIKAGWALYVEQGPTLLNTVPTYRREWWTDLNGCVFNFTETSPTAF
jgi:hypothetical protein